MSTVERAAAVDLLDRLHRAQNDLYAGGEGGDLRSLLTAGVRWSVPGTNALAGDYQGLPEVLGYMRRRRRLAGSTLRLVRRDVLVGRGPQVAALTDGVAVRDGRIHRWSTVGLYEVSGGRVARCWLLPLDPAGFDAVWS